MAMRTTPSTTPTPERPVTGPRPGRRGVTPLLCAAAAMLSACEGTQTVDGILAPSALSASTGGGAGRSGGSVTIGRGQADLVGSWTRVSGTGAGVLTEQTFTFSGDGSGARTTVTRTALGIALAIDQAPFTWNAGGGILQLRFVREGTVDPIVRSSYVILADLTATVLRLDGVEYVRSGR
jgi:hypothetical protein